MHYKKINNTRVVPVTSKIIFIFVLFILVTSLSTNYINLVLNRSILLDQMKQTLNKELQIINDFCIIQAEIYHLTDELKGSIKLVEKKSRIELKNNNSIFIGLKKNGKVLFFSSPKIKKNNASIGKNLLMRMNSNFKKDIKKEFIYFNFNNMKYFGLYSYNSAWNAYLIRAEETKEFFSSSVKTFWFVSIIVFIVTAACAIVGIFLVKYILRFIAIISSNILRMLRSQELKTINMDEASNDTITLIGIAFNSLSNTVNNLVGIFRKFATRDIAQKAYREKSVSLEGEKRELTILFTDIKGFTYMSETLGIDIISLLNMHYDKAIREILDNSGIIGSIVGDALLAVFGTRESEQNKSFLALISAYNIHQCCENLRLEMYSRKEKIVKLYGSLSEEEENIFKAVLLEIGVGIDGGNVFYGNIGSNIRMTNTVIGDKVNSASRLESLTRMYKVPVICSEYVKSDIEDNVINHNIKFVEIDRVQVKGKTKGMSIYWPIFRKNYDNQLLEEILIFTSALTAYFIGNWETANRYFRKCKIPLVEVFIERTKFLIPPDDWDGIWTMNIK